MGIGDDEGQSQMDMGIRRVGIRTGAGTSAHA